jgi:hypothetical protein
MKVFINIWIQNAKCFMDRDKDKLSGSLRMIKTAGVKNFF